MANPILAKLNRKQIDVKSILQMAKGNPDAVFNNMMQTNPQFARFVKECEGKTPDQIAREHGISPDVLKRLM